MSFPTRHLKPGLRRFAPYTPGLQPPDGGGWVKLNTNESPWPPSPRVLDALHATIGADLRLYPNPIALAAREAVATAHGLRHDQVAMGNGGDELIELCFRAFAGRGDRVAFCEPTYPLLMPLCGIHEVIPSPHSLSQDWAPPSTFAADEAPLKFFVNPNSPTGTWLDRQVVERVVAGSRGVVVLDEAYVDFAPEDRTDLLAAYDNLLILRTFSKSYALAGMRIGYALGHPDLIAGLDLVKDSYNLDRLAIAAAVAAIADREYHDRLVAFVLEERAWLAGALRRLGFEVAPPATNFLFVRPPGQEAGPLVDSLRDRKVLVRHYGRDPIAGWLRITIGTREQHERLLGVLQEVMG